MNNAKPKAAQCTLRERLESMVASGSGVPACLLSSAEQSARVGSGFSVLVAKVSVLMGFEHIFLSLPAANQINARETAVNEIIHELTKRKNQNK